MFIKNLKSCNKFVAGDGSILRELLNARKGKFFFRYSLAHAVVKHKKITKPHRLKTSEVYYILNGIGRMRIDKESKKVNPGDTIYIPPRSLQYIENIGKSNLVFLCIVDPAWCLQDEEVIGDGLSA
ncbi:MAG: cupin domain-containing protein [Candidatus Omnitrophota bacterium]|nr:cupin domain-containing protein [Candidatus Omnitrophota bacterium]MBU1928940.1 cupin domain-containing protein [Candidatus Omnitrophota bacterium]MBU2034980.1 cupin domain-containing protein [Candidatus Omnitrophota bacterium]MBU2222113.1 cupin domain-containing protein [Candidatus Omnitrophota bacterium]MBU2258142.1 cupin domain-containing protein [Candidatus Omnitrophota bacterium]